MSLTVLGRSQWGALPPKWRETFAGSQGVFLHYNGGTPLPASVTAGDSEAVAAHLRSTQSFHMNVNGWPDIAYSFAVDALGRIYELRGWGVEGAHTFGWNSRSHAIYLPLGGDQEPTDEQVAACRTVIAEHNRRYGQGFIKGHQQAPNATSCPGGPTMALLAAGRFDPNGEEETVPRPPGVQVSEKPSVMRNRKTGQISVFYPNTPFRIDLRRSEDVQKFLFFGAVDKGDADPWFWERASSAVKVG